MCREVQLPAKRLAGERWERDGEDGAPPVAFVDQLALVLADDGLLYEQVLPRTRFEPAHRRVGAALPLFLESAESMDAGLRRAGLA